MMGFEVTMVGSEPVTVKVTPKVIVAAERQFKMPMSKLFSSESMSFEAMSWIAWKAMHTAGHVVKTFDLWLDELESVEGSNSESDSPLDAGGA